MAWFGLELVASAGQAGLAERVLGEAQAAWPFVVVMPAVIGDGDGDGALPASSRVRVKPMGENACDDVFGWAARERGASFARQAGKEAGSGWAR